MEGCQKEGDPDNSTADHNKTHRALPVSALGAAQAAAHTRECRLSANTGFSPSGDKCL